MVGATSAVAMKGRVKFGGLKRSRCHGCGGAYHAGSHEERLITPPPNAFIHFCTCPDGWMGEETHIQIGEDTPPTREELP